MKDFSERRLLENEVIFKQINTEVKDFILDAEQDSGLTHKKLRFYCECSNMDCRERVEMTAQEYDDIHANRKRFVLKPGHELPDIENKVDGNGGYIVVEKLVTPPPPDEIDPERFTK